MQTEGCLANPSIFDYYTRLDFQEVELTCASYIS